MNVAIVTGAFGQDGRLLVEALENRGMGVIAIGKHRTVAKGLEFAETIDLGDESSVRELIRLVRPTEVYHLATIHESSEESKHGFQKFLEEGFQINVQALGYLLESIRMESPRTKLFFASSCHVFGVPSTNPQNEDTLKKPMSLYGIAKRTGMNLCNLYRERHRIFASCGILYSHESPLRSENFLIRKVVRHAARASLGHRDRLLVGSLDSKNDWGFAPDYVDGMQRILSLDTPQDFIIATGIAHSVRDAVRVAFETVGLDWREFVQVDPNLLSRDSVPFLGDPSRIQAATGWSPTIEFEDMVRYLVTQELNRDDS